MKLKILFIALMVSTLSWGQAFTATYPFTSVTTTSGLTDPTAVPTATGVTFGSFSSVVSTNPNATGRFSFTGWDTGATNASDVFTGAINTAKYYQVTITPLGGYTIDISSITFTLQRSGTGIRQYAVRSSLDYTTNLPASISPSNANLSVVATNTFQVVDASTAANVGSTITLGVSYTNISSPITFRFYGFNAEASGGSFSTDDVVFNGTATSLTPIPVVTASTFSGTVGTAFSNNIVATNSPTSYAIVSGTLPAGLSFNTSTGAITGTPTASGTSTISVTATNAGGTSSPATITFNINPNAVPVVTASTFTGIVGNPFSNNILATNPVISSYNYVSGTYPPGLSLNTSTGVISGTPTTSGTYTIQVTATNVVGTSTPSTTITFTIYLAPVVTASTFSGTVGTAFSNNIVASNSPTSYALVSGTLPAGLSFNTATGAITGTPTASGTSTISVTATNPGGTSSPATITFNIDPNAVPVVTASTFTGIVGNAFSNNILATNPVISSYNYVSGTYPPGLSLSTSTGVISGTPTTSGSYSIQVTATNVVGTSTPSTTITFNVYAIPVVTASTFSGTVGTAFSNNIVASNLPTSYAIASGTLPAGLSFNTSTGAITGTPTTSGTSTISVTASNPAGTSTAATITFNIDPNAVPVVTSSSQAGALSTLFSYSIVATNPVISSYNYVSGTYPPGLSLNTSTGLISGTPTTLGNYSIQVTATNVVGTSAAATITFDICSGTQPLNGTYAIPSTCFPTVASAVTYLNSYGVAGAVIFNVAAGYTETTPSGGFSITATGTASNTITFIKSGAGANPTFTAFTPQPSGNLNNAIFKIIGGDYITIDGFTMQENASNTTTTAASNNMTEWGVALLYASTLNGAQNNTIQNCIISLNRTYQNTWGIYANATHSATAVTTSNTATTTAGGNSGLKIYGNTISNVNNGISVVGPTAAADANTGIDIGGTGGLQANTITNFGTTGTFSSYVSVSGTVNGILVRNSIGSNISFNTITSSVGGVTLGTLNGIQVPAASAAPTTTFTNTINSNTISLQSGLATGGMVGISYPSGSASPTSTLNVNSNNFVTFGHTVAGTAAITFITVTSTNQFTTINSNTFTNISVNTTGNVTFISASFTAPANGTKTINGNNIVTAFNKTGAGGTVTLYNDLGSSTTGTSIQNNNNNFSNITVIGATIVAGWFNQDGTLSTPLKTITGNTFSNWTCGTGAVTVLQSNFGGTHTISSNTISNITGQGAVTGLQVGSGGTIATSTITTNTISGLSSTGAGGAVTGITSASTATTLNITSNNIINNSINAASSTGAILLAISNTGAAGTVNINSNIIRNMSSNDTSGQMQGIINFGAVITALNINNNQLGNATGGFFTSSVASSGSLFGISSSGGAATCATAITGNDIRGITYSVTASAVQTYINSTGTPLTNNISNNTFTNLSVNTTGNIYLIYNSYSAPANGSKTVSGNTIVTGFARTAGGAGGFYGYYDFGSSPSTVSHTITNNNFSNITINATNTGILEGLDSEDYLASNNPTLTITNNTMSNWTNGSGSVYAIVGDGFAGTLGSPNVVSGNSISNVSTIGAAVVYGIYVGSITTYLDVYSNSISQLKGLTSTTGGDIIGIFSAGATGVVNLYKNNVNGLSGIGSATTITGIYSNAATTRTIYNNLIGDLTATASASLSAVEGISLFGGTTSNIYYNTVYFTGTSSAANFGTSALYADNTGTKLDLRNNILINTSTPKGTGRTTAFNTPLVYDPTYYVSTSNNNLFYAGTPGASNLIFYDGTNSDQTLAAFQTRVGPTRDVDSVTEPFFVAATYFESIIGSNSLYLKPKSLCNVSSANNAGAPIGSITDDYNSAVRNATTPDIGAWEFDSHGKRWNGTVDVNWSTIKNWTPKGVPLATDCVYISAGTPNAAVISGDNYSALALNLTVDDAASLTVNSGTTAGLGNTITVTDSVIVTPPTGSFTINNNSSLVQITDVDNVTGNTNSGNITYIRTTRAMRTYDYVYWGSPITKSGSFSQIPSAFDRYYKFVTTGAVNGTWTPLTTDNIAGQGYITRVKNDPLYTPTPSAINYPFVGKPNNGVVNITATNYDASSLVSGNTILLANPYPSAIDADTFIAANIKPGSPGPATITGTINQTIGGALYFWTSNTAYPGTGNYNFADYCTYTKLGIASGTPGTAVGGLNPTGKIAAGQGFFAQIFASGPITFNNSMRVAANNANFFRNANATTAATTAIEKHCIWLNYTNATSNSNKAFRQMLIGYADGATNDIDNIYDGHSFTNNQIDLYSIVDNENFSVQARALPFQDTDLVPLGFKVTTAGAYTISIDHVDGLFEQGQPIFMEDKILNIIHDLRQAPYSFTTAAGRFDDRFVLRYTNTTLSNPNFEAIENSVVVATNHGELTIKSSMQNMQEVTVYDIVGRQLFFVKAINDTSFMTSNIALSQQTLIVKIKMENGTVVTRKIVL